MPESPRPGLDRAWLHRFATETRGVVLHLLDGQADTCIASTRVGLAVLERYGVAARPQPVFVTVHNREAWLLTDQGVPISQWPATAHSLGVDERHQGTGWNGHLVLLVRSPGAPRLLIDLSADQFSRPAVDIQIGGPIFMDIVGDWTPHDPLSTVLGRESEHAVVVSYRPMAPGQPLATQWRETPDWTIEERWVERAADAVSARIGEGPSTRTAH